MVENTAATTAAATMMIQSKTYDKINAMETLPPWARDRVFFIIAVCCSRW
jgi:hypothetical protein